MARSDWFQNLISNIDVVMNVIEYVTVNGLSETVMSVKTKDYSCSL